MNGRLSSPSLRRRQVNAAIITRKTALITFVVVLSMSSTTSFHHSYRHRLSFCRRFVSDRIPSMTKELFNGAMAPLYGSNDYDDFDTVVFPKILLDENSPTALATTKTFVFDLAKKIPHDLPQSPSFSAHNNQSRRRHRQRLSTIVKSLFQLFHRGGSRRTTGDVGSRQNGTNQDIVYQFSYECDVLELDSRYYIQRQQSSSSSKNPSLTSQSGTTTTTTIATTTTAAAAAAAPTTTTGVIMIHPIGVGIGRWFYQRLLDTLPEAYHLSSTIGNGVDDNYQQLSYVIVAPDLVGSATGCNATNKKQEPESDVIAADHVDDGGAVADDPFFPLFNISDWTDQLLDLMHQIEQQYPQIDKWAVVANGGCSPIALQVASRSVQGREKWSNSHNNDKNTTTSMPTKPVTNVILSSVPLLSFFLTSSDPGRVHRSYKTLCGWPGRLFWWYACRNGGIFIQTFSEKNLVADPANLGDTWKTNCYDTAIAFDGQSRYSTFSFLAGTLQDGCSDSLNSIKGTPVQVDIIRGKDVRKNRAKSLFWQKKRRTKWKIVDDEEQVTSTPMSFAQYIEANGNGGREVMIDGRISLAHEDAIGYADALIFFLSHEQDW